MTYCVGALVEQGIVFASDSRTAAGFDNISTYCKMNVFETPGERVIVILSSGNLATTQGVLTRLRLRARDDQGGTLQDGILGVRRMYEAAQLVGTTLREVVDASQLVQQQGVDIGCHFIVGGQIDRRKPRLFHVYPEGNFIEATEDTNFFQIGEHKYGKPILDRAVRFDTDLYDALKIGLISMDSTMRSNLAVGLPIDLAMVRRDSIRAELNYRIEPGEPYFTDLRERWSEALRAAHIAIPRPPYVNGKPAK